MTTAIAQKSSYAIGAWFSVEKALLALNIVIWTVTIIRCI